MDTIALGIALFFVMIVVMYGARGMEKRAYNGGICPGCAQDWRQYDVDSTGARGYTCDTCNKGVWVSYWGIDDHG